MSAQEVADPLALVILKSFPRKKKWRSNEWRHRQQQKSKQQQPKQQPKQHEEEERPNAGPTQAPKVCFMFMFRSRRTTLTRRLVKARKRRCNEARSPSAAAAASACTTPTTTTTTEEDVTAVLKRLQDNQLQMLWSAVESRGRDASNCVLLPRTTIADNHNNRPYNHNNNHNQQPQLQPHLLCYQTWRWPDLVRGEELRRLPDCRSACDPVYICCNPYHWSRVFQPEIPPPPYSRCDMDRLKPEDRAPSENACLWPFPGSLTTNGDDSRRNPLEWCKLAYWEQAKRVGPLFPVESPAVNIFGNVPYGDGLCLETLALHNCNPPESVRHTRCKIGLGVTLSLEGGCVWLYNRSDNPIFVNSMTLEGADPQIPTRVPAEQCLCVFDPTRAAVHNYNNSWGDILSHHFGPVDPNSIRISFAKGWGPRYSRQEITSCPCWLEILLAPCR